MGLFSKFFKSKNDNNQSTFQSAVSTTSSTRTLNLKDSDCAIILHESNPDDTSLAIEFVPTKFKSEEQIITTSEHLLMTLGFFLKQDGFAEMLMLEFDKIANSNININKDKAE